MQPLSHPFTFSLWFDKNAEEAAQLYTSIFPEGKIGNITRYGKAGVEKHHQPEGGVMGIEFSLAGVNFVGINAGPEFKITPAISFSVNCTDEEESDKLWNTLIEGGSALMPYDKYPWSAKYGWLKDKYGVTWQISIGQGNVEKLQILPSYLLVGDNYGRAEEALNFYAGVFADSTINVVVPYGAGEITEGEKAIKYAQITINKQPFVLMENNGAHHFDFNEGVSVMVNCETQDEIDYYWEKLTDGGQEIECGWLKDKFGASWQVNPVQLDNMLQIGTYEQKERVMNAFMAMKKFDIAQLEKAFAGE